MLFYNDSSYSTIELLKSPDLLELLKTNTQDKFKDIADEILSYSHKFNRHFVRRRIHNYYEYMLYLVDKKGIRGYAVHASVEPTISFSLYRVYDTLNKRDAREILELVPLNQADVTVKEGRIYYETENCGYDLRLWTLVIDLMAEEFGKREYLFFNEYTTVDRDYFLFSKDGNRKYEKPWYLLRLEASRRNESIKFGGMAEKHIDREKYLEFYFDASFNMETGVIKIVDSKFSSWNYK